MFLCFRGDQRPGAPELAGEAGRVIAGDGEPGALPGAVRGEAAEHGNAAGGGGLAQDLQVLLAGVAGGQEVETARSCQT
jgi:hypothetical protein